VDDTLALLGVPRRRDPEGDVLLPPGQATQLAALLAVRGDWVARGDLVATFWPDADRRRGRHNLSQLLYAMRRSAWGHDLETEATRVRWPVPCDVAGFRQAAGDGDWARATELYAGELLEGTGPSTSPAFDGWLLTEREDLRESWRDALFGHASDLAAGGRWQDAARLLRRLLAADELLEEAVQALIRCEARAGRRDAALQAYEAFRARLADELSLEPLPATARLADAVRSGELGEAAPPSPKPGSATRASAEPERAASVASERDVRPGPVRNLATDATPFVGRDLELAELHGLLGHDDRRHLTIHGPGGSGKSRLARQLARERAGHHQDGAAWVPLHSASSEPGAVAAIARALGVRIEPEVGALVTALEERDLLLVLDQAEHLPELAGVVAALLDGCPHLRMVVTSRAPLDVPGEAVAALAGLTVPPGDDVDDAEAYDAVGLLLRAAHRVRPDLHPRGAERTALVALTRLLDGGPLAIELAAGWLRLLAPSEVLREVQADLDVLRTADPGLDPRHASLRAVFESSWKLLGEGERDALRRLAVFRGGCSRDTAAAVADVPLHALLALTNRSLLHRDGGTRFVPHPVVQRFAQEKLSERRELARELGHRHRSYFVDLAVDADRRLDTPEQRAALALLDDESGNLAWALEGTLAADDADAAYALTAALGRFWRWRGVARGALPWFDRIRGLTSAATATPTRVRSLLAEGLLLQEQRRYAEADAVFERALADAVGLGDEALVASARVDRAIVAWRRGDLVSARALLESARDGYRALGREASLAGTLGNLGTVERDAGDLAAAHARFDEALALAERVGSLWETANVRNNKAIAHAYGGDLEAAGREFARALELQRSIGDRPGISRSLTNLGNVHLDTGDPDRARELYREALELCQQLEDHDGAAHLHVNLAIVAQRAGDFAGAHELYGRALRSRHELGARALVAQSVSCFLDLAVARGAHERALVLAGAVRGLCEAIGVPLTAPQQGTFDEALARARAAVPTARATDLEARGAALSERDAVTFALGERTAA
jgi:predicted ATPase/DNA-binding SARP family transcriptional activator